jgi:hypothetical protein
MLIPKQNSALLPAIPAETQARFEAGILFLRPFGQMAEDLEINFQGLRPEVEVQILCGCTQDHQGKPCDRNLFWHLEVGKRTECLVTLAMLERHGHGTIELRCANPQCQQMLEIELSTSELASLQSGASATNAPVHPVQIGDDTVLIRKPTGLDQLQWLEQALTDESTLIRSMLTTLVSQEQQESLQRLWVEQPDWVRATRQALSQVMTSLDPLVNFSLSVACPECEAQAQYALDLGAWALRKLERTQKQLLRLVHRLASHYHWSEAEIFAIPPWRRQHYLALIEQEVGG